MKSSVRVLIFATGCVALAIAARATVNSAATADRSPTVDHSVNADNPYGAIVERNIFDLHDPPPQPPDKGPDKGPPPNIKLTGITTIFGRKQALFLLTTPGAAGKPPGTHSLILNEGQRSDQLEVLEIDPKGRSARVKLDEVESTLTIETNKGTINPQANAGGPPGAPGAHTSPYGAPGSTPPGFQPKNPYGNPNIPARPPRTDIPPNSPQAYNSGNPYGAGAPGVQTPQGALNFNQATTPNAATPQPTQQLSQDEQAILIEAQRAQAQATGDPIQTILPPTAYSQQPNEQPTPNESGNPNPNPNAGQSSPSLGTRSSGTLQNGIYVPGR